MESTHLDLVCRDVSAGAAFFRDILALPVRQSEPHYAEVDLGRYVARLTPPGPGRAPAPAGERTSGVILQVEVPDVGAALDELRRRGATVLMDTVITEWGTESAFIAGPDDMILEIYRTRVR